MTERIGLIVAASACLIAGLAQVSACAGSFNSPSTQQTASDACATNLAKVQLVKDQAAKLGIEPLVLARRVCDTALLGIAVIPAAGSPGQ